MIVNSTIIENILSGNLKSMIDNYPEEFDDIEEASKFIGWEVLKTKKHNYDSEKGSVSLIITLKSPEKKKYKLSCPYYTAVGGYDWDSNEIILK